jgi:hypothetical protein
MGAIEMADEIFVGGTRRLSTEFTVSSVATDPTTVSLVVTTPSGAATTYTYALAQVTKSTTGNYYKDITWTEKGWWKWRWEGTGTCAQVDEGHIYVM